MERLAPKTLICCLALGLCVLLGPVGPASAQAGGENEPWRVLEKYGSVRYRAPAANQWSQAVVGAELPLGSRIVTGEDGWVLVRHADGNFWVEPNARFVLPSPDKARVRQEVGNLHYRIIRMEQQRFEVETPYASLVVKGTTFDVRVSETGTAVDVARGWVEVATPQGSRADLRAGQAARISSGAAPRFEVRPAPGQAFEPVQPDRQITPAGAAHGEPSAQRGWFERILDMLSSAPAPTTTADAGLGGGGNAGLGGGSGGGSSSSSDSGSTGSSGGGSGDSGSGDSGSSGGSSSSGSSGESDSGGSGSSSGSGGGGSGSGSGGGSSSSSGSGGGVGVGASVGGVSVGASVGGGGVSVGASVGGFGVGVGIGR